MYLVWMPVWGAISLLHKYNSGLPRDGSICFNVLHDDYACILYLLHYSSWCFSNMAYFMVFLTKMLFSMIFIWILCMHFCANPYFLYIFAKCEFPILRWLILFKSLIHSLQTKWVSPHVSRMRVFISIFFYVILSFRLCWKISTRILIQVFMLS